MRSACDLGVKWRHTSLGLATTAREEVALNTCTVASYYIMCIHDERCLSGLSIGWAWVSQKGWQIAMNIVVYLSAEAPRILRGTFPFMRDDVQYFFTCTEHTLHWDHDLMIVPAQVPLSGADGIHWTTRSAEVALSERLIDYIVRFEPTANGADRPIAAATDGLNIEEAWFLGSKHFRADRRKPLTPPSSRPAPTLSQRTQSESGVN